MKEKEEEDQEEEDQEEKIFGSEQVMGLINHVKTCQISSTSIGVIHRFLSQHFMSFLG